VGDREQALVAGVDVDEEVARPRERLHVAPALRLHADAAGLQRFVLLLRWRRFVSARAELLVEPSKPLPDLHPLAARDAERERQRPRERVATVRVRQPAQRVHVLLARENDDLPWPPLAELPEQRGMRPLPPIIALARRELGDRVVVGGDPIGGANDAVEAREDPDVLLGRDDARVREALAEERRGVEIGSGNGPALGVDLRLRTGDEDDRLVPDRRGRRSTEQLRHSREGGSRPHRARPCFEQLGQGTEGGDFGLGPRRRLRAWLRLRCKLLEERLK
jgi:hypothetical protein